MRSPLLDLRGLHAPRSPPQSDLLSEVGPSTKACAAFRQARAACASHECVSQLTPVDLAGVLHPDASDAAKRTAAAAVLHTLRSTGCLVVRDPRVPMAQNDEFLNIMETYFDRPAADKMADCRPETHYQTGATPSGTEVPRCLGDVDLQRRMRSYSDANAAVTPERADVKWRYFWPLHSRAARARGDPPYLEQVVPRGMPAWRGTLDAWGGSLVDTVETIALLLAVGYGLREDAFTELLEAGHHLLAPTGCDLRAHARPGAVFAGYHYDFNFLTCHGKSRYPGLRAWLRDGSRLPVRVPDGCLLLQAGRQLAWLTGGDIEEGMHEVVCSEQTLAAVERARTDETRSLWRVSSTVFAHVGPDVVLRPIAGKREACDAYPPTPNREFVAAELRQLKLAADVATAP